MSLERLKDLMLNDNGFAFDPRTGLTYTISVTGLTVIRGLKEELDEAQIVERIVADYEVDSRTAARDVRRFLESLRRLGLVDSETEGDQTRSSTATPTRSPRGDEDNEA